MTLPQNPVIVGLGILLSFLLFAQGEKYNLKSTDYGQMLQNCQARQIDHENCVVKRNSEIIKLYGEPYTELEARKQRQMIFLVIPTVVLIVAVFVSLNVTKDEKYLTMLALAPLFLSFLRFFPYAPEKWMTPVYLLFSLAVAGCVTHFKRTLFNADS
ncbi:MAG TPA: hypothetical protein VIL74_21285 [Pyrinomonadaceae bacterium]|jgi:hypothetical protein